MKKILLSLGTITAVIAPVASVVACGNKKVAAPFETKTMDDLNKEYTKNYGFKINGFNVVNNKYVPKIDSVDKTLTEEWLEQVQRSKGLKPSPALAHLDATELTEDTVKEYWNKPEGSIFRLALILFKIGRDVWQYEDLGANVTPGDAVIRAILFGVKNSLVEKGEIDTDKIKDTTFKLIDTKYRSVEVEHKGTFTGGAFEWGPIDTTTGNPTKVSTPLTEDQYEAKITKKIEDDTKATVEELIMKEAGSRLNQYKLDLINNINSAIDKYDAMSSMEKFASFVDWMVTQGQDGGYPNLRSVLMGGLIDEAFVQGIQQELNTCSDTSGSTIVPKRDVTTPVAV